MQLQRDLISVVIPAYNQPQYLRSALQSIVDQDYRPIEVIVSDDCSPTVLQPVTDEFSQHQSDLFTVRYFRAAANRGVIDNFRFAVEQARGAYLVPMAHDNRFVDRRFFTEAVRIMGGRADCHLCYGNAFYENSDRKALNIPVNISLDDGWAMLEGKDFIRLYRRGGMDWSQAIVLDNGMAHSLGAYDVPYVVNGAIARRFGISQDDMFSYVFLLSAMGSVGLCEKPVCEIGTPRSRTLGRPPGKARRQKSNSSFSTTSGAVTSVGNTRRTFGRWPANRPCNTPIVYWILEWGATIGGPPISFS